MSSPTDCSSQGLGSGRYQPEHKSYRDRQGDEWKQKQEKTHRFTRQWTIRSSYEEALVARARAMAQANELNPELAEDVFRWMIEKTLFIEIAYLRQVGRRNEDTLVLTRPQ